MTEATSGYGEQGFHSADRENAYASVWRERSGSQPPNPIHGLLTSEQWSLQIRKLFLDSGWIPGGRLLRWDTDEVAVVAEL